MYEGWDPNGHLTSDRIMFDCVRYAPFGITFGSVRSKESVLPCMSDYVIVHVIVKWDVFEFVGCVGTKNTVFIRESHQYWFEFIAILKNLDAMCQFHE